MSTKSSSQSICKIECPLCLDRVTFDRIANIDWSNFKFDSRNSLLRAHTRENDLCLRKFINALVCTCSEYTHTHTLGREKLELWIHVHHENEYKIAEVSACEFKLRTLFQAANEATEVNASVLLSGSFVTQPKFIIAVLRTCQFSRFNFPFYFMPFHFGMFSFRVRIFGGYHRI